MKEKTQIEKIIDAIEFTEEIKKEDLTIIKENRKEEWNEALDDSPYNPYYGVDIKCAVTLMKGIERGLKTRDALYLSEHHFGIPAERTMDILFKYSTEGERFYKESTNLQRLAYYKERAVFLDTYTNPKKLVKKRDV